MKKTFRNIQECIHTFAQFTQNEGKCGNVFFYSNTLYSYGYHFPLAVKVTNEAGQTAIILNGKTYSNSTSKHQNWTRQATSHFTQIVSFGMSTNYKTDSYAHRHNEDYYISRLQWIAKGLSVARNPAKWINEAECLQSQFLTYCSFFGIQPTEQFNTAYHNATNVNEEIKAKVKAENARQLELKKEREAENKKAWSEKVAEWIANEREYFPSFAGNLSWEDTKKFTDILRVRKNGQEVETSKGIIMTMQQAKAIYHQLSTNVLMVGDTVLDAYTVTAINGVVKIGCHTFETDYLLTFGKTL